MAVSVTQKITPFLWFEKDAEEAMRFYTSIFKNSRIVAIQYYPEGAIEEHMQGMEGKVLTGVFELDSQRFMALDGGPVFKFSGAISFLVDCEDQQEVDYFWEKLSAVPEAEQCGWLQDKYGVSWQIVPKQMGALLSHPDAEKAARAMDAMLKMKKIDMTALQAAFDGVK